MANIVLTYILWLFGGPFGLHHFYLGRDKHAFVWWVSLGGCLLGWLRDLWRLPEYVYAANSDPRYIAEFQFRRSKCEKPPFSVVRFAGQFMIGSLFGYLLRLAVPQRIIAIYGNYGLAVSVILPIIGCTIGIYLVSNIGTCKLSLKHAFIGSCIASPFLFQEEQAIFMCPLFCGIFVNKKLEWRVDHQKRRGGCCSFMKRVTVLSFCGLIYLSLWSSMLYTNVNIRTANGEEIPLREVIKNFFNSPAWMELKTTGKILFDECNKHGWNKCLQFFVEKIDPTGESHAYKVLGFEDESPTPQDIKSRCRQLKRQYHPDKQKTDEEKESAKVKFIEVDEACQKLDVIKQRRAQKNMESVSPTTDKPPVYSPRDDL